MKQRYQENNESIMIDDGFDYEDKADDNEDYDPEM